MAGVLAEVGVVGEAVFLYFITGRNTIPLALGIFLPPVILALVVLWGLWKKGDYGTLVVCSDSTRFANVYFCADFLLLKPEPVPADTNAVKAFLLSKMPLRDYIV